MNTTTNADRYIAGTLATLDLGDRLYAEDGDPDTGTWTGNHAWFELYDWMLRDTTLRPLGECERRYLDGIAANQWAYDDAASVGWRTAIDARTIHYWNNQACC